MYGGQEDSFEPHVQVHIDFFLNKYLENVDLTATLRHNMFRERDLFAFDSKISTILFGFHFVLIWSTRN